MISALAGCHKRGYIEFCVNAGNERQIFGELKFRIVSIAAYHQYPLQGSLQIEFN